MIYARDELRLTGKAGRMGPALVVVLVIIALALLTRDAMSQEVIESFDLIGTVVDDQSGEALVGAFVSMTGSEWGSITDEDGHFQIPDVFQGSLSLTTEQLGYETLVWEGDVSAESGALRLSMSPQPILLEGLRVVSDRFRSRRNRSHTSVIAFDRDALATTNQRTLLDFVALRVGSTRTTCGGGARGDICFRLRGRSIEPIVFIDEAPIVAGLDYLDAMEPRELYMVEIFGSGRHIRAYTKSFMARAAKTRLQPVALLF